MKKFTSVFLAASVIVMSLVFIPSANAKSKKSAAERSQDVTETYQRRLEDAVPYPLAAMRDSIERRNLRERLLRFNRPDKIGYVYLLSDVGTIVAFYVIRGKVSSNQSQLTASQRIDGRDCYRCANVIDTASDDGSYGPNEDGVFFFTTEGVFVQWNGKYILADAPLKVASAPLVTIDPSARPSSTSGL